MASLEFKVYVSLNEQAGAVLCTLCKKWFRSRGGWTINIGLVLLPHDLCHWNSMGQLLGNESHNCTHLFLEWLSGSGPNRSIPICWNGSSMIRSEIKGT